MSTASTSGPPIPAALGKYEIRGLLGRGAMGVVYDGWDPVIHRRIAIKTVSLLPGEDEAGAEALARFRREAQAAGRLHHPNIVSVFDYGETDNLAFIVMEFVEGRTLKDMVSGEERMTPADAVRVMLDVLAGLDYSHERGVVHRDIKPANIMLTADGQAKIADFGIARIESSSMTQAGMVMGTPAYMSPEQFMGNVVDRRTDIYSCGVVLYQLLAGERPFDGNMSAIMHKVMTTTPPRPSALSVMAPRALDAVVAKAMAVRPEDRYATAPAFADALRAPPAVVEEDATVVAPRAASSPPPAPAPIAKPAAKSSSRTGLVMVGAGLVLLLAGGGGAAWLLMGQKAEERPAPAQTAAISAAPERPKPAEPIIETPRASAPPAETPAPTPTPTPTPAPTETAVVPPTVPATPAAPSQTEAMNTPPPAAPPVTPPVVVPPVTPAAPPAPTRSPAEIASLLTASLPSVPCSLARVSTGPSGVVLTGLAGAGDPASALRRVAAAADPAGVDWHVRSVNNLFCGVLDLLRGVPDNASGASLEQEGGAVALADNEIIALRVTMPGYGGYLHMAYVQSNGSVSLLVPSADYPLQTYPARASINFGQPRGSFPGWRAGPPFGTDMVVAVASTAPLFSTTSSEDQPLDKYLSNLNNAIQAVRRRGGSVSTSATIIETRSGPATPR